MTQVQQSSTPRLSKQRRYRYLMYVFLLGGVAVGLGLRFLDYHVLSEAVYWVGILAAFVVWKGTSVTLFDERDKAIDRRASQLTMTVTGALLIVGASVVRLGTQLGVVDAPPMVRGALYGCISVFVIFGLSYLWVRYRP
ncbi:DUF2178 domain-containing protein [Haloferax larsenii]|uniref:Predicted membrane protein n=1 Tax=Haloferax larsenii TaxID=302484 RepID=A0A1H7M0A3_HALLR|nr:DUF2178 domain-containing protein [Haloferax larsenii]SEL04690.1 Predicted membrane protein [Haloferax larsenii]